MDFLIKLLKMFSKIDNAILKFKKNIYKLINNYSKILEFL